MKPNSKEAPAYDDALDEARLKGIANGDRQSFRDLYERYDGLLFTTIEKVLNDREDSQEVLQEVMSSLWRKAHLYHPGRGRPITWLASTARNRAIDRLRSKQRQSRLKSAYTDEMDVNPRGSTGLSGPEAASRRDTCSAVRSAVMELTDVQREAIEKVYFEGLTQQEIADQLGEPLGTVKARIRRGLAKLRKTVEVS
ncbi:MAG: sigma-70 family RNA polymerase sigma factor [Verrucomicrobiales bacterium]|jgi:RNA polymerase sigma-70 factor (ECF subfamily)|nr:sigma-70 family RNA polymerase sigma factor [Verrucomicrobiales bacterium]